MLALIDTCGTDSATPYLAIAGVLLRENQVATLLSEIEAGLGELLLKTDPTCADVKATELLGRTVLRRLPDYDRLKETELAEAERIWRSRVHRREPLSGASLAVDAKRRHAFVQRVFQAMTTARARIVAVVCNKREPRPRKDVMAKPYAFLFERVFHALHPGQPGAGERHAILVFDDEDTETMKNINRWIRGYFSERRDGLARSQVIVPAPFYVRSVITPLIVLPDLVAYCLAWGWRGTPAMVDPGREDLRLFVGDIEELRADCGEYQDESGQLRPRHSIYCLKDLRAQ